MDKEIIDFLDNDVAGCLNDAVENSIESKARNRLAVRRMANDASIGINQLLGRVKEEFGGTEHAAIMEKVAELEEIYSAEEIYETLRGRLGLRFIESFRSKLHEEILHATSHFEEIDQATDELLVTMENWFTRAGKQMDGKFPDQRILDLVEHDIKELKKLYTDREALRAKFLPFSDE